MPGARVVMPGAAEDNERDSQLSAEINRLMKQNESAARSGMSREQRELLRFYKRRVQNLEAELFGNSGRRLQNPTALRARRYEVELTARNEEVRDLQRALSDAQLYLYDEREVVLKLSRENERLRIQEAEDRKRIQSLLSLTRPVAQEVTYYRSGAPPAVKTVSLKKGKTASSSKSGVSIQRGGRGGSVVRTIVMPNDVTRDLEDTVASLRAQLREREALFEERARAEREAREVERAQFEQRRRELRAEIVSSEERNLELERLYQSTIRDLLRIKFGAEQQEQALREKSVQVVEAAEKAKREASAVQATSAEELQRIRRSSEENKRRAVDAIRGDMVRAQDSLLIVKQQYLAAQKMYEARIAAMQEKLDRERVRRRDAQRRRALEKEGYASDLRLLKQKFKGIDRTLGDARTTVSELVGGGLSRREAAMLASQLRRLLDADGQIRHIKDQMEDIKARVDARRGRPGEKKGNAGSAVKR